ELTHMPTQLEPLCRTIKQHFKNKNFFNVRDGIKNIPSVLSTIPLVPSCLY
ncbi:13822_t:CDS:2, partial [Cetraspora pellucida]